MAYIPQKSICYWLSAYFSVVIKNLIALKYKYIAYNYSVNHFALFYLKYWKICKLKLIKWGVWLTQEITIWQFEQNN